MWHNPSICVFDWLYFLQSNLFSPLFTLSCTSSLKGGKWTQPQSAFEVLHVLWVVQWTSTWSTSGVGGNTDMMQTQAESVAAARFHDKQPAGEQTSKYRRSRKNVAYSAGFDHFQHHPSCSWIQMFQLWELWRKTTSWTRRGAVSCWLKVEEKRKKLNRVNSSRESVSPHGAGRAGDRWWAELHSCLPVISPKAKGKQMGSR